MLLPFLAVCWLLGFVAVGAWDSPWWLAGAWLAALLPVAAWLRPEWTLRVAIGALLAAAGGLMLALRTDEPPPPPAAFGSDVHLEGVIASEPDPSFRTVRYRLDLAAIERNGEWSPAAGAVLITLQQYAEHLPGDRVRVRGALEQPTDDIDGFDYRAWLLSQGVTSTMLFPQVEVIAEGEISTERLSARVRLALEDALQRALPEPEASLAAGIAIGRDDGLSPELAESFRRSGLAHLTAVSGGNIAILSAIVFTLLVPVVGRRWAVAPAAALLAAYVLAAGFEETIVRSSIMAGVYLFGLLIGRPQSGLAGLALAVMVMTALDPGIASDAGFQLSAAATAGLIVLSPWLRAGADRALVKLKLGMFAGGVLTEGLALTLSATIATLPIVAFTFERVSLAGLLANLAAGPLFVLAFPLSLLTAVAGTLPGVAGWAIALVAYYPLAALVYLAEWTAALPGAAVDTPGMGKTASIAWVAAWLAGGTALYMRRPPDPLRITPRRLDRTVRRGALALGCGALAAWIGFASLAPLGGPGELEIHVLDVGQGDAILLRTPGGTNILVDGGPSAIALMEGLGRALPHWERTIDLVLFTHPQEDHIAGLVEANRRYDVSVVASNGDRNGTTAFRLLEEESGPFRALAAGDQFSFDGVSVSVLWPPPEGFGGEGDLNDRSIVLRVTYGHAVALLTGDIETPAQMALLDASDVRAQVLKVPHHGASTSSGRFFQAVGASAVAISAGEDNRFGHPAAETLNALTGATVFRTDEDGTIVFRTDGHGWRVETDD